MARRSILPLLTLVIMFLVFHSGLKTVVAHGKSWCVAKPSASETELKNNIAFACNYVDCSVIQPGGACFEPQATINHASVVMNAYYQKNGRHSWNCNFTCSALTVVTDPSYCSCSYVLSSIAIG
ncbi:hypothetical protein Droror1_Dr00022568 [Drosera rotundifolia]